MKPSADQETWYTVARHYLKFNVVGAIGIGVQLAMLALLVSGFKIDYLLATFLAVEVAVLHNFVWHEHWTWADRRGLDHRGKVSRLIRFNVTTGAFSILGNLILMKLLVSQFQLHYFLANIITIGTLSVINFLVSDRFVFRQPET